MKLENLKVSFNARTTNGNSVDVNFEIGALTLDPQEHADEIKLMERLLPMLNSALTDLTSDMAKAADNKKKEN